jgi:hypothetical protein
VEQVRVHDVGRERPELADQADDPSRRGRGARADVDHVDARFAQLGHHQRLALAAVVDVGRQRDHPAGDAFVAQRRQQPRQHRGLTADLQVRDDVGDAHLRAGGGADAHGAGVATDVGHAAEPTGGLSGRDRVTALPSDEVLGLGVVADEG